MLQKNNIALRAPELDDVDFLFALENDSRLWHLSNTTIPFSRFDIEQYILQAEKDAFASRQIRFMIDKISGKTRNTIGAIDLFDIEPKHRRAGIGIMIVEEERAKGLASIAVDVLIDYTFNTLNMHQLYCNIEADNNSSLQLFENKGFERIGIKKDWNMRSGNWMGEYILQLIN